jgi:hypothetical protein
MGDRKAFKRGGAGVRIPLQGHCVVSRDIGGRCRRLARSCPRFASSISKARILFVHSVGLLALVCLALGVLSCSDGDSGNHKRTDAAADAPLTAALPQSVQAACARTKSSAEDMGLGFVCPPLVPRGATRVQGEIVTPDYYALNFVSPALSELGHESHFGHWLIQGGDREAILVELATNIPGGLPAPVRAASLLGTPVKVYNIADYQNVNKDHVVVVWEVAGNLYDVSVHGIGNEDVALDLARGVISCQGGDRPGTDC